MTLIKRFIEKTSEYSIVDTLFLILLFYLPFLYRFHQSLDKLAKKAYSSLAQTSFFIDRIFDFYLTDLIIIGVISYVAVCLRPNLKELFWDKEKKWMTFFLILSGISLAFSDLQAWAIYRWLQMALIGVGYLMISQTINLQKILLIIFGIVTSTALAESIIVIMQYFSQEILGLKHLGERTELLAKFGMQDKSLWSLGFLFKAYSTTICRAQGTFPHPNILGGFLGFSLFSTYFLFLKRQSKKMRFLFAVAICIQFFALFLTFSRASIFACCLASLLLIGMLFLKKKNLIDPKAFYSLCLTIFLSLGLCISLLYPQLMNRGGIVNYNAFAKAPDQERLYYQNLAWEMTKLHPLTGVGYSQFLTRVEDVSSGQSKHPLQTVHNIYLLISAEMGLPALIVFLIFIGSLAFRLLKALNVLSILLLSILSYFLLIGCCDHYLLFEVHGRVMFFMTMAFITAGERLGFKLPQLHLFSSQPNKESCKPNDIQATDNC